MYLINICKRTLKIYMWLLGLGRISGIAGITDIRTDPNCIVIKIFANTFFSSAISGYPAGYRISGINNQLDIRYPAKKVSGPTLVFK